MKIYKITIIWKDFNFPYEFLQKSNTSVWASIADELKKTYDDFATVDKGTMNHMFLIPCQEDMSSLQKLMSEIVTKSTGCDIADIHVGVSELSDPEKESLLNSKSCDLSEKEWAKQLSVPSKENAAREASLTDQINSIRSKSAIQEQEEQSKDNTPAVETPSEKESEKRKPEKFSLLDEAKRIEEIRKGLLEKVRGQQHAINEVVRSVFEFDTFTCKNDDRKGPLSTFLFTGPSGVGKTQLAKTLSALLQKECLTVDMSEYSDNLANLKFNGEHGQSSVVTGFVRKHPDGIIIFDEIEKAHINTIHLFLQILDEGRLMDMRLNKEVSFKDTIVIITTNAGKSLYEDPTIFNLSNVPKSVILDALRSDVNEQTKEPFFPECITTRFANGKVLLFNHLEPYALMQIVQDEIETQVKLFTKTTGVQVEYDPRMLSALVLFQAGGRSDARTLQGLARSVIIGELHELVMERYAHNSATLDKLEKIQIIVDPLDTNTEIRELFRPSTNIQGLVIGEDRYAELITGNQPPHTNIQFCNNEQDFKKGTRGVIDFIIIDPLFGEKTIERRPDDIEDIQSSGIDLFEYVLEYYPEIPVYLANTDALDDSTFITLLNRGAKGIIPVDNVHPETFVKAIDDLSTSVQINNSVFKLSRSGKSLSYNCAQYTIDEKTALISFDRMKITLEAKSSDRSSMHRHDENSVTRFSDIIGCKSAKEELKSVCEYIRNPREFMLKGLKMGKGILLYGPPGTGKTMLGKAMASEANAAFFQTSATSFFGPLVGQTEQNIRQLFAQARRYAPSIIFIDEVDAIARARTNSGFSMHNEDALNALIAEMDGFATDPKRPVYVMAATNYDIDGNSGRVLDPAFVRRFNKRVLVSLPDESERCEFLTKSLTQHGITFDNGNENAVESITAHSAGMSNADLRIVVESFLRVSEEKGATYQTFMEALEDFKYGEARKTEPEKLARTACHESGHGLVSMLTGNVPAFMTVVSRGDFGGYMQHKDNEKGEFTKDEILDRVCCSLAGRAAEIVVYGEQIGINTGASSDIKNANALVKAALDDFGMGTGYGESTQEMRDAIITEQFERAKTLLTEHRNELDELTDLLVQEHSLDQKMLEDFAEKHFGIQ